MAEEGCCHDGGWRIGTKGAPADVGFLREHVRVDDLHTEGGAPYKNTIFSANRLCICVCDRVYQTDYGAN